VWYNLFMERGKKHEGILLLKTSNEAREIEFELSYLISLTPPQRFRLMERKSREMRSSLYRHGHGTSASITKRK
jgi:hypothetical protein